MIPKGLVKAKAIFYVITDVEGRRHWSQKGLVTLVVFAVNYECHRLDCKSTEDKVFLVASGNKKNKNINKYILLYLYLYLGLFKLVYK